MGINPKPKEALNATLIMQNPKPLKGAPREALNETTPLQEAPMGKNPKLP